MCSAMMGSTLSTSPFSKGTGSVAGAKSSTTLNSKFSSVKPAVSAAAGLLPLPSNAVPLSQNHNSHSRTSKVVSNKEIDERRAKGLCYWCSEKYVPGHNCPKRQIHIMEAEDELEDVDCTEEGESQDAEAELSIHALTGVDTSF